MKKLIGYCLLLLAMATGCVTKSELKAREHAAFLAGEKQGAVMQENATAVVVVGNVRTPTIPWSEDLTLTKALIIADYQGVGDPGQVVVMRKAHPNTYISAKQLLGGFDMALQPGDQVQIRP